MTTTTAPVPSTEASTGASRPSARRRAAVAVAAFLACAIPVTFTVTITAMLRDRRRSRPPLPPGDRAGAGPLRPLARRAPPARPGRVARAAAVTAAGYRHLAFVGHRRRHLARSPRAAARRASSAVVAVTGALLWAALPLRPRLRAPLRRPGPHAARPARRRRSSCRTPSTSSRSRTLRRPATTPRTRTCSTWLDGHRPSPCWRCSGRSSGGRAASSAGWPARAPSSAPLAWRRESHDVVRRGRWPSGRLLPRPATRPLPNRR